jgi:hypothetical protein
VAQAHAEALSAQIRLLRVQRAALRALARRDPSPEEVDRMNRIAQATADERRRAIGEFLDHIFDFGDGPVDNDFTKALRGVTPELPDDPSDEQLDAWLELAELVRDEGFRARLREMGRRSFGPNSSDPPVWPAGRETADLVAARVAAAVDAGIAPDAPAAAPIVAGLVGEFAAAIERNDSPAYRRELLDALVTGTEPRAERYWQLLAIINGWPPIPSTTHLWIWFADALRATLAE